MRNGPELPDHPFFQRCCLNTTCSSMELAVPFCDAGDLAVITRALFGSLRSRQYRDRSLPSEFFKSVIEAIESLLENRAWRRKVEAQPGFAAWPELLAGACENARPILDPCRDVIGRQSG